MLHISLLKFLKDLENNNTKPWFESHRTDYEKAKNNFLELVQVLIREIGNFDKPIAALEAKHCVFRINRDVRFSKNKAPYKNNIAGYFNKDGKKGNGAGYYLHIQPGKSFAAAGIWMPEPVTLFNIRQEIDYNLEEWKKIINATSFKKYFPAGLEKSESLTRPPKGYEADNPALTFIKLKSFIVSRPFNDKEVTDNNFEKEVAKTFKTVKPLIDFINRSIDQ